MDEFLKSNTNKLILQRNSITNNELQTVAKFYDYSAIFIDTSWNKKNIIAILENCCIKYAQINRLLIIDDYEILSTEFLSIQKYIDNLEKVVLIVSSHYKHQENYQDENVDLMKNVYNNKDILVAMANVITLQAMTYENNTIIDAMNDISIGDVYHTMMYKKHEWESNIKYLSYIGILLPLKKWKHLPNNIKNASIWSKISNIRSKEILFQEMCFKLNVLPHQLLQLRQSILNGNKDKVDLDLKNLNSLIKILNIDFRNLKQKDKLMILRENMNCK